MDDERSTTKDEKFFILHMAAFCQGRPLGATEGGRRALTKCLSHVLFINQFWSLIFHNSFRKLIGHRDWPDRKMQALFIVMNLHHERSGAHKCDDPNQKSSRVFDYMWP
jgi:hypothetical protein